LYGESLNYKGLDKLIKRKIKINDTTYRLDEMERDKLCELIKDFLDNNYLLNNYNIENQSQLWNKFNINNYTGKCALYLIQDSINNDYSNYKILERLKNFFTKRGKSILIAISISVFILLSIFVYSKNEYIASKFGDWNFLRNYRSDENLKNYKNDNDNLPEIPEEFKEDMLERNKLCELDLNMFAGDDNKISKDEYKKFLEVYHFFEKDSFVDHQKNELKRKNLVEYILKTLRSSSDNLVDIEDIYIAPNLTYNEYKNITNQYKNVENRINLSEDQKKIYHFNRNTSWFLDNVKDQKEYTENPDFNPFKNLIEKNNYTVTTESIPINNIKIPFKIMDRFGRLLSNNFHDFLSGILSFYQNETITLVNCIEQGQQKYYIYEKNASFIMRLLMDVNNSTINSNIINTNGTFNDFIKSVEDNKIYVTARDDYENF
jgi:hypothetical protein